MFDDRGLKNAADAAVAMMKVFWCGEKAQWGGRAPTSSGGGCFSPAFTGPS
jgi:hypothetical protein